MAFVHKTSSFGVVFPQSNWTLRDIVGGSFTLEFQIVEGVFPAPRNTGSQYPSDESTFS